ncbi:hypothetical protein TSHO111613_22630 [Tsukamurella hominis]
MNLQVLRRGGAGLAIAVAVIGATAACGGGDETKTSSSSAASSTAEASVNVDAAIAALREKGFTQPDATLGDAVKSVCTQFDNKASNAAIAQSLEKAYGLDLDKATDIIASAVIEGCPRNLTAAGGG